jgi:hypothetical protein
MFLVNDGRNISIVQLYYINYFATIEGKPAEHFLEFLPLTPIASSQTNTETNNNVQAECDLPDPLKVPL